MKIGGGWSYPQDQYGGGQTTPMPKGVVPTTPKRQKKKKKKKKKKKGLKWVLGF
jgi:hypothetical protein